MFERYEKWWILAILAIVIYYLYKKGTAKTSSDGSCAQESPGSTLTHFFGSIVNPTMEPKVVQPAQSTTPVLFTPAQPSSAPTQTRVSAGTYNWSPVRSPIRYVELA